MEKKILFLAGALVLAVILIVSVGQVVLAGNTATQNATTNKATTIEVRSQDYSTTVSAITFPPGAPSAEVSLPTNGIGAEVQTFGIAGTAKPVVTLFNGSAGVLTIWYNISTFTNGTVSTENYLINTKAAACANAAAITNAATFDTDTISAGSTTITNGAGNEKDLYLKIGLSAVAGKTGTSTLSILGET